MISKLLRHPQPFAYESLANYMFRLSESNFCSIAWLDDYFKIHSSANSLDKYNVDITPESMNLIAEATELPIDDILEMTINRFNLQLFLSK